jgi:hypothetical protein
MGRDIAAAARLTMVPPGAADVATSFDDEKRFQVGFQKLDSLAEAGKAGADD